jgi:SAM-dependent methyltransferase
MISNVQRSPITSSPTAKPQSCLYRRAKMRLLRVWAQFSLSFDFKHYIFFKLQKGTENKGCEPMAAATNLALRAPLELSDSKRELGDLSDEEFAVISPYRISAFMGKKIIHPGGRFSTRRVLKAAQLEDGQQVLEVGCGVGFGAIKIAKRAAVQVTAIDIDPQMLIRAAENVTKAAMDDQITIRSESVEALPFLDNTFDRIIVESVTMFTNIERATAEMVRVLKPGGILVDHEFAWNRTPSDRRQKRFSSLFAGGHCDVPEFWKTSYAAAGLKNPQTMTGPVLNFTPPGIMIDEGPAGLLFFGRAFSRWRRIKRMGAFVIKFNSLIPAIRYVITTGTK